MIIDKINFTSILWNFIFFACLFSIQIEASYHSDMVTDNYEQWFLGSIHSPLPITVDPQHPSLEIEFFSSNRYGNYNSRGNLVNIPHIHSLSPSVDFQFSFNKIIGFEIISSLTYNSCGKEHYTNIEDTIFRMGFQISNDTKGTWIPDFRIVLEETFPTGKYQNLDPKKKGCDITGQGSFQTGIYFTCEKQFYTKNDDHLSIRTCLGYFIPTAVSVRGFNYYGGSANSLAIVYPGNSLSFFLLGEYALTSKWAIACEFNYLKGWKGCSFTERGEEINVPRYSQITLNPQIQYTFTRSFGLMIGCWFTVSGENSPAFTSFFISSLYIF